MINEKNSKIVIAKQNTTNFQKYWDHHVVVCIVSSLLFSKHCLFTPENNELLHGFYTLTFP